jgi:hypothetical protein
MTSVADKYRALVLKLYNQTINKNIEWAIDPFDRKLFVEMSRYKIRLYSSRDADGEPFENVEILNSSDETIDFFTDGTVSGKTPGILGHSSYYELMRTLRVQAHRQASGADQALDDILDSLGEDEE